MHLGARECQSRSDDFSFSSHLYLTACLRCDVKAARCAFDWLCLCGPDGFATAKLVALSLAGFRLE